MRRKIYIHFSPPQSPSLPLPRYRPSPPPQHSYINPVVQKRGRERAQDDPKTLSLPILPSLFYHTYFTSSILPYLFYLTYSTLPYPTLPILPNPTLSYLTYPTIPYPILPYLILSIPYYTLSYPIIPYPIPSYPTIPYPIIPYYTLSYPIIPIPPYPSHHTHPTIPIPPYSFHHTHST